MTTMRERDAERFSSSSASHLLVERPPIPRNMMVELTNGCNHACIFCTNSYMTRRVGRIAPDLLDRVMREAYEAGTREIGFYTTGDPFVHKELEGFIARAKQLGYEYTYISTNGASATRARIRAAVEAGIDSIKFSINAGSRETYKLIHGKDDWEKVLDLVRYVAELRKSLDRPLKLFATCVVTRQVEHEVAGLAKLLDGLVDEFYPSPCTDQVGQMDSALSLLGDVSQSQKTAQNSAICNLPFSRLHVTCEGYLTLCCVDYQNYLAIADLNAMSLSEAWHGEMFVEQRRRHLTQKLTGTLCGACWKGDKGHIAPLSPGLATKVEFPMFKDEIRRATGVRLDAAGSRSGENRGER